MKRESVALLLLSQLVLLLLLWQLLGPEPQETPVVIETPIAEEQAQVEDDFQQQSWVGRELPELVFLGPNGPVETKDFRGKPLVLEFMSTSCPYCQRMAPKFSAALPSSGAEMLTVSVTGETLKKMGSWHQNFLPRPMPGQYAIDSGGTAVREFDLRGTPTTLFVRADGQITSLVEGEFSESQLRALLREIGA